MRWAMKGCNMQKYVYENEILKSFPYVKSAQIYEENPCKWRIAPFIRLKP